MSSPRIFTIGHSNHTIETFIDLLKRHGVTCLVDVRSAPYSRYSPHFRKRSLEAHLGEEMIEYVYLGGELGGRPGESRDFTPDDMIEYRDIARQPWYEDGLQQLLKISRQSSVAIMCSEENPDRCHRNLLIAQSLLVRSLANVQHIRGDGTVEPARLRPEQTKLF